MAIDKDKVLELFGRYWEIAYNEGRTGEGFPDLANDVLAELRDVLDADDGDVFTGQSEGKNMATMPAWWTLRATGLTA